MAAVEGEVQDPVLVRFRAQLVGRLRAYEGCGCGGLFEAGLLRVAQALLDEHVAVSTLGPGSAQPAFHKAAQAIEDLMGENHGD